MSEKERHLADAVEKYKEEMQQNFIKLQKQDDNMRRLHQVRLTFFFADSSSSKVLYNNRYQFSFVRHHLYLLLKFSIHMPRSSSVLNADFHSGK